MPLIGDQGDERAPDDSGPRLVSPREEVVASPKSSLSFRYRAAMMTALLFVYILNFADRVVLGILATPIKRDLHLDDTHLGLLGGTSFALFYSLFGIPVALLADRTNRVRIVGVALILWSAFTALCGGAASFAQMFAFRLGVGVGEAGGVAPSYSLITDYFPPAQRARALGFFSFGIPVGSAAGLLLGGLVATTVDWRVAFYVLGGVGLLTAPAFLLLAREPVRGGFDSVTTGRRVETLGAVLRTLRHKPAFWLLAFGYALNSVASYGVSFWLPSFLIRTHGLTLLEASHFYAAVLLIGGVGGIWIGASVVDRYGPERPRLYMLIPLTALLAGMPLFAGAVLTGSLPLAFVLFLLVTAVWNASLGPALSAIQHLVPPTMRATTSSISLFLTNLIGLGGGALVLGLISDSFSLRFGADSLRYALLAMIIFQIAGATLFFLSSRVIERDWERT